ncbi:MAG: ParB/RepB/Spo0J family partition protein, partial [Deltaproteobacteria bacterium]|nr:ParB/RepB/Spo0J family partition protein [Deltaproteobacteria bacterium]
KGRRALGRGLDALLPARPAKTADPRKYGPQAVFVCAIERVAPRRDQPRRDYDAQALAELAATIAEHGVIQPIVVRKVGADAFEIIAGERRWRAAQRAGLKEVPVVVKDVTPEKAFEMALVENLQREDLNPMEVAEAYQRLLDDHGSTQAALAKSVGKSRVAVTNALRLLKLPQKVHALLRAGAISEGHGRALLGAPDDQTMITVAHQAARGHLSVRKVEQLVRRAKKGKRGDAGKPAAGGGKSASVRDLEQRLSRRLGARTTVEHKGPGGTITVRYADLDGLDRIIATLDA